MNAFHRIFLLAIAIALMSFAASVANAGGVNVRMNRFTPFNIRPDVRVNNVGHAGVSVNVNGGAVRVNDFRRNNVDVFVNGGSGVFVVPQAFPVLVTPNVLLPLDVGYGVGVSVRTNGCFRQLGGCCH